MGTRIIPSLSELDDETFTALVVRAVEGRERPTPTKTS